MTEFEPSQLPDSVLILGKEYPVKVTKLVRGLLGQMDGQNQTILISNKHKALDEAIDTLFHEILHAIEFNCGLEYNETWVLAMTPHLIAILRGNPKLTKLIVGSKPKRVALLLEEHNGRKRGTPSSLRGADAPSRTGTSKAPSRLGGAGTKTPRSL